MINKYYVRKLKKLLEKNTRYYNKERAGEPLPYIITDEKDYYLIKLYIEKLTDKNDITDGLVDILENRVIEQQKILDIIKEYLNKVELGELENGKPYTFKDFLKEEKATEVEEAEWLLELLEEIE